ncbi:gTPase Der [Anopheles sinensis]|uniref:GTPase Der n=1 Tax=Anopheles sinensis TaxID=74873 RepID=A0A084VEP6_ANOSI|nr:gTPase Der [Anopheles sinensis]
MGFPQSNVLAAESTLIEHDNTHNFGSFVSEPSGIRERGRGEESLARAEADHPSIHSALLSLERAAVCLLCGAKRLSILDDELFDEAGTAGSIFAIYS